MNTPLLVAALLVPLVAGAMAFLVPSGRSRPPRRRSSSAADGGEGGDEGQITLVVAVPDPELETGVSRAGQTSRLIVRAGALVAAGLWIAVVVLGGATAGSLVAMGVVGPAAAGAALLLASVSRPAGRLPAAGASLALSLLSAGLALAGGSGSATPTAAVLALAGGAGFVALATARENDGGMGAAAIALVGMVGVAGGLVQRAAADATAPLGPAVLLTAGGTLIAVAGALRPRRSAAVLLPVGLAIGIAAGAGEGAGGEAVALVLALGAVAVIAAWAIMSVNAAGTRLLVVALALVALAVASVPAGSLVESAPALEAAGSPGAPAAWLLAASTVIVGVVLVPAAAFTAVPGAAAFALVVAAEPSPIRLAVAGLALAAVVAAAFAVERTSWSAVEGGAEQAALGLNPLVAAVPALAVGLWLLVAPETWAWAGDANLADWPDSIALVTAAGLIGAVTAGSFGRVAVPRAPRVVGPDPETSGADAPATRRMALLAGVGLAAALLVLVVSG